SLVGRNFSFCSRFFTASNIGRNLLPAENFSLSKGKQRSTETSSIDASRNQLIASPSSSDVWITKCWFQGSPGGMFSRLGVVRNGPCTRKPRCVSTTVGKKTTKGDVDSG